MYVSYTTSDFSKRLRLFLSAGINLREREKLFIKLPKGRTYQNWKEIPESISLLKKKTNKTKQIQIQIQAREVLLNMFHVNNHQVGFIPQNVWLLTLNDFMIDFAVENTLLLTRWKLHDPCNAQVQFN